MKAFITKYAILKGILEVDATPIEGGWPPNRVSFTMPGDSYSQYARKGEWHTSIIEAIARAEEMRLKVIDSLKKKLAKLEKMNFK